ncbi:hypothetical protein [Streptomyces sp. CAU 1734]|uniref:hypothetical protein n=1 Tax=Streptomyces sp. CAU 1734 TaxID=3140360 RepID=UPI0032616C4D
MDPSRTWYGRFVPVRADLGPLGHGWAGESPGLGDRSGPLRHPESLPWRRPETGQVLSHDEEDHCSGLWMRRGGGLVEVPLPGTERFLVPRRGGTRRNHRTRVSRCGRTGR